MQSTRGYSFLAQTYKVHLVAGSDPDWMRFTPKTNHSRVHLKPQRDQLLQRVLRSLRSHLHKQTTQSQKNRLNLNRLNTTRVPYDGGGYILKALISV